MTGKAARFLAGAGTLPWRVPAAIGAVAALLEIGAEPVRLALRYDREALLGGELWRLVTGHLVHLGPSHMAMNVVALAVLVLVLGPLLRERDWLIGGLAAALAIDLGLMLAHPGVAWYVGLSGVLHGFWSAAAIRGFTLRRPEAVVLALLLVAKLGYEIVIGPVPMTGAVAQGPVVTAAHAWGALGGALWPLALVARRSARPL